MSNFIGFPETVISVDSLLPPADRFISEKMICMNQISIYSSESKLLADLRQKQLNRQRGLGSKIKEHFAGERFERVEYVFISA